LLAALSSQEERALPVALRTKPTRILEDDQVALRVISGIENRSPAEVFHAALSEYIQNHKDSLGASMKRTQAAVAAGDLAALVAELSASTSTTAAKLAAAAGTEG
jgi:hypothetical protein